MSTYWIFFLFSAFLSIILRSNKNDSLKNLKATSIDPLWVITFLVLIVFIGLRHQVGGDWDHYLNNYYDFINLPVTTFLSPREDIGYIFFSWISSEMDWGIYGVNLLCSIIFVSGLLSFCKNQQNPILALTVAIPYLVIVVSMGYTRQSAALGFIFLAIVNFFRGNQIRYLALVAIASLLHKSAIIMAPLAIFVQIKNKRIILVTLIVSIVLYFLVLEDIFLNVYTNYVLISSSENTSSGALVRLLMNAFAAFIFLILKDRLFFSSLERGFWFWISCIAILALLGNVLTGLTTIIDRFSIYLIPLQLAVFSSLPSITNNPNTKRIITTIILLYFSIVLFVWLNYADHSLYWLPYNNLLLL